MEEKTLTQIVTLSEAVMRQLRRLRTKHADSDGKDASFSFVIRKSLEENDMWVSQKPKSGRKKKESKNKNYS